MRTISKSITGIMLLACIFAANAAKPEKLSKKVDAKCHVQLLGGEETVAFWSIPSNKLSGLVDKIVGSKVITNANKKTSVYKAFECVLLEEKFTHGRAQAIDAKTPK